MVSTEKVILHFIINCGECWVPDMVPIFVNLAKKLPKYKEFIKDNLFAYFPEARKEWMDWI